MENELYKWSENNLESDLTMSDCINIVSWFKNFINEIKIETINEYTDKTIQYLTERKLPTKITCPDCNSKRITHISDLDHSCQKCGYLWEA